MGGDLQRRLAWFVGVVVAVVIGLASPLVLAQPADASSAPLVARRSASRRPEPASQASQFLQRSQRQGLPTKIDANGVIRVYDPATNTFGAYNPNGTTATFFTPKTGADYWAKQPGVSPWSP